MNIEDDITTKVLYSLHPHYLERNIGTRAWHWLRTDTENICLNEIGPVPTQKFRLCGYN